jgi:hypothetical protein
MMKTYIPNRSKPRSLTSQIRDAERQVLQRQLRVGVRTDGLVRKIHQQMTAPATLLLAGGMGFIIGELTKRQTTNSSGSTADKPRAAETSPLKTALSLMASVHTLYTALPIVWMLKYFHQPGESDRKAPERQYHPRWQQPVTAKGQGDS